jgi:glutamine amidotransferase
MSVVIIDYESGNLHSALKAFERANRECGAGFEVSLTRDPEAVRRAERIVLPGVGAFGDCYQGLHAINGMREALEESVRQQGKPFLGICVGMQMLAERGLEHGDHQGLGWIPGQVELIRPSDPTLKIPHMGWNTLDVVTDHPLLAGIPTGEAGWHAYFVHSYHFHAKERGDVIAETEYGGPVTAMVGRDNLAGTQFQDRKSTRLNSSHNSESRMPSSA